MIKVISIAGLLFCAGSALLFCAESAQASDIVVGQWSGGPMTDDSGKFSDCTIRAKFSEDLGMYLMLTPDDLLDIGIMNRDWIERAEEDTTAILKLDQLEPIERPAQAGGGLVAVPMERGGKFLDLLRRGKNLKVTVDDVTFDFDIADLDQAGLLLEACVEAERIRAARK